MFIHSKIKNNENAKPVHRVNKSVGATRTTNPLYNIFSLHGTLGNQAVHRLIASRRLQAKLAIGKPNDIYEHEADRIADQVMKMSDSCESIQPMCRECQDELNQQPMDDKEDNFVQTKRCSNETSKASTEIENKIKSTSGNGRQLEKSDREFFESRFGYDFSRVRVHTDSQSVQMNRELNSHAFTVGKDIYFNEGTYKPNNMWGKRLLAHELTHTIQQNGLRKSLQRLTVSPIGALHRGACGERRRVWKFELDNPAPDDGYMVQQIDVYDETVDCPSMAKCPANPSQTFWEAWRFNKGDTLFAQFSSFGLSDVHSRPGINNKSGYGNSFGTIKFFLRSTTGDLGDLRTAPSTPNGGWGPGNAPPSGILPSTTTRPSWWNNTPVEGPETRYALGAWRCCGDSNDFNDIRANP